MFTIRSLGLMLSVVMSLPVLARGEEKPATAPTSNMTEKILFVSSRDQERGLAVYSMNPDGSEPKRLTEKGKTVFDPVFSPNRTKIAFSMLTVEDGEKPRSAIFVMNADGSQRKQLTESEELQFSPAWSPDGKRIAFALVERGGPRIGRIFSVTADGKNRRELGDGLFPQWSPDGKQIAYSVMGRSVRGEPALMIMDADGKNSKRLIEGTAMMAVWSPDGKQIAYIGKVKDNWIDVMVMDADGTNSRQVTETKDVWEMGLQWSTDGKRLYFATGPQSGGLRSMEIFSIGIDGKNEKQLTDNEAMDALAGAAMMGGSRRESKPNDAKPNIEEKKP